MSENKSQGFTSAQRCFTTDSLSDYQELDLQLKRLETLARESFQEKIHTQAETLVHLLESNRSLNAQDLELLDQLIVGDARQALQAADEFQRRKADLQTLVEALDTLLKSERREIDNLLEMQVMCRRARLIMNDLNFFLQEKERLERFEASVRSLSPQARQILAELIREMLHSARV